MRTELLDYDLPAELIAEHPPPERDGARLLAVRRAAIEHHAVRDWPNLLPEGALVVVNDTRVRRARIWGKRAGSLGKVELLFLEQLPSPAANHEVWRAIGRASKPLRPGTQIELDSARVEVIERDAEGILTLRVAAPAGLEAVLERDGHVPLPPYLRRSDTEADRTRYQTIFARRTRSVAAPTAGLHLTPRIFERLHERGIEVGRVELDVGLGTFRPVNADDLDQHVMHREHFDVSPELCAQVAAARARNARVIAVGTTVVRALESAADPQRLGHVTAQAGLTQLLIQPGYVFRVVDALLTNFHQPRSTLLALVAAFVGYETTMAAYAEAVRDKYRFLSFGDAMWLPERLT